MLTKEQRDKWAEELESGRWKQTRKRLSDNLIGHSEYCCLGVLWYKAGIDPNLLEGEEYQHFCDLNDISELSFPEIAKHVRALPVSDEGEP